MPTQPLFSSPGEYLDRVLKSHHRKHVQPLWDKYHKKRQEVSEFLVKQFGEFLAGSPLNSGSYAKNTDINTSFDLDLVFPFRHQAFGGPEMIYTEVFKSIQRTYAASGVSIRPQRTSTGIKFKEKVGQRLVVVDLDIVPGMEVKAGAFPQNKSLILNNREKGSGEKGQWIKTNVHEQIAAIRAGERANERKIIKLLKIWKFTNNQKASSFLLELAVLRAFKHQEMKSGDLFGWLQDSLEYISDQLPNMRLEDPGNKSNNVADNLTSAEKAQLSGTLRNMLKSIRKDESKLLNYFPINPIGK